MIAPTRTQLIGESTRECLIEKAGGYVVSRAQSGMCKGLHGTGDDQTLTSDAIFRGIFTASQQTT